jgi:hypothetical protein
MCSLSFNNSFNNRCENPMKCNRFPFHTIFVLISPKIQMFRLFIRRCDAIVSPTILICGKKTKTPSVKQVLQQYQQRQQHSPTSQVVGSSPSSRSLTANNAASIARNATKASTVGSDRLTTMHSNSTSSDNASSTVSNDGETRARTNADDHVRSTSSIADAATASSQPISLSDLPPTNLYDPSYADGKAKGAAGNGAGGTTSESTDGVVVLYSGGEFTWHKFVTATSWLQSVATSICVPALVMLENAAVPDVCSMCCVRIQ